MVNYASIQHHIDRGLGIAGKKLGPPFAAFRPIGDGDFPTGWQQVGSKVPIFRRRAGTAKLESAIAFSGTMFYEIIGNMEPFLLGDVFVTMDPPYSPGKSYGVGATQSVATAILTTQDGNTITTQSGDTITLQGGTFEFNGFTLCWHPPVSKPYGARVERRTKIRRPMGLPDTMSDGSKVWRQSSDRADSLTFSHSFYQFTAAPNPGNWIPCGISSTERPGRSENFPPKFPGMQSIPRYYCYLPYLPGYEPEEGDILNLEDGTRFRVLNPYRQEVGVVGSQMAVERLIGQDL